VVDVKCSYEKLESVDKIIPNPKNTNIHTDEQIALLKKLITKHGFRHPLIVSKRSGFLVAGHARLKAAQDIGMTQIPVDYQDFESEAMEFAFLNSDNEVARLAKLDEVALTDAIKELNLPDDFDMELFGIPDFEIPEVEVLEPQCDEDEVPEQVDTRAKLGDVWLLGEHRLMCGDSTSIDAVEKLMNGEKADMVFTDPPYGINYSQEKYTGNLGRSENNKGILNDDKVLDMNNIFVFDCLVYIWGANNFVERLPKKGTWHCWDKRSNDADEIKGKADGAIGSQFELVWCNKDTGYQRMYRVYHAGFYNSDGGKRVHPTQKPTKLAEQCFRHEKIGENSTIVDLFGGSGSTLIACEKTNRKCYMSELDPHYVDVILARWEKYTGKTAKLA